MGDYHADRYGIPEEWRIRRCFSASSYPGGLLAVSVQWSCAAPAADQPAPKIEVYFSPNGGCTDAIVKCLDGAKETVLVQAYYFTSSPIAKALLEAHQRGVKVQVILDKSQRTEKYTRRTSFRNAGIPTFIDAKHAIAHNKVMVIDGRIVITGSFNFTKAAEENNAENLLVIRRHGGRREIRRQLEGPPGPLGPV